MDGFGSPLLILTDYCDFQKQPINNAVYLGMCEGWVVFSASAANHFGECVDVAAHEFTHGITAYITGGNLYENACLEKLQILHGSWEKTAECRCGA